VAQALAAGPRPGFLGKRFKVRIPGQGDRDSEVIPISIPKLI
jgi:hypothetical protein